jgi:hypothetical protein
MTAEDQLPAVARTPADLRARAEEVLAQAEAMSDADAWQQMRGIATTYEKLAQRPKPRGSKDAAGQRAQLHH